MSKELFVRDAVVEDAEGILARHRALAEYCGFPGREFGITREDVEEVIEGGGFERYFVLEADREVAGMAYCTRTSRSWRGTRGAYLEDLYVDEAYRYGLGSGKLLLGRVGLLAIEYAGGQGMIDKAFIRLDTNSHDNDPTIEFYRRLGFVEDINFRLSGQAFKNLVHAYGVPLL